MYCKLCAQADYIDYSYCHWTEFRSKCFPILKLHSILNELDPSKPCVSSVDQWISQLSSHLEYAQSDIVGTAVNKSRSNLSNFIIIFHRMPHAGHMSNDDMQCG